MSSGDLGGFSLFDLFRSEAESHGRSLNDGLLKLESAPDDISVIEPLMRAAHSLKGAARIIGLDIAVRLAHAMEDAFVAAQKGRERLGPARIDQLLQGTDLLTRLAAITEAELPAWTEQSGSEIDRLCEALAAAPPADAAPAAPPAAPVAPTAPTPAPTAAPQPVATPAPMPVAEHAPASAAPAAASASTPDAKTVRVSADSVDRIMRLAGEMTVESRRIAAMRDRLQGLKDRLLDVGDAVERLEEQFGAHQRVRDVAERVRRAFADASAQLASSDELARRIEETSTSLYHATLGSRMRPFGDITQGFPRMVRDVAKQLGKQVKFEVLGARVPVDRDILARLEAPLNHMLRNAVDHGVETPAERIAAGKPESARVQLEARHHAGHLIVRVSDDGRGIDPEKIRAKVLARSLATPEMAARMSHAELMEFLFLPGFSTATTVSEISGRGVGLDVVQSTAQEIGGTAAIESRIGAGTSMRLQLPLTLSVARAAVVEIAGESYAFPLSRLERVVKMDRSGLSTIEGRQQFMLDGVSVGTVDAATLLGFAATENDETVSVMVVAHQRGGESESYGLVVSRFEGESDLVVRPLDERLGRIPHISAAALKENGDPLLIVDVDDLVHSVRQLLAEGRLRGTRAAAAAGARRKRRVLVVDDSLTVREVERQLLTRLGYEVDVAVDGADGLNAVRQGHYDLVVSDVDMPRMNGFEFVAAVRREARFADLPIVIVSYKDREEDRIAGMQAGANAYLTKGAFRDETFARTIGDLVGGPESDA
ncbi:MAG: hybrid sensor histidine kinase/response regulator [Phycisphaerales bacterium]